MHLARPAALVVAVLALLHSGCDAVRSPVPPSATTRPVVAPLATWQDLPVGPATRVPWWVDGVLHVGDREVRTPDRLVVHRGGTTVVGRSSLDGGAAWFLVVGDRLVPVVRSEAPLWPVVSADGQRLAWVADVARVVLGELRSRVLYRVVSYDVRRQRVAGTWQTWTSTVCCDAHGTLAVVGIDLRHRVLVQHRGPRGLLVWTPGREPVPVRGSAGDGGYGDPWPRGTSWPVERDGRRDVDGAFGTVDDDGRVRRSGTMPDDQRGVWADDGSAFAHPGDASGDARYGASLGEHWVTHLDGTQVHLELPPALDADLLVWEGTEQVLLSVRRPGRAAYLGLARCDAVTGACERVADGPPPRAVLPERR